MSEIANFLYVPAIFLAVLTIVVFIHELGHFLVARWCGVSIEAFSIGFGREICGFYDRHGTRWKISWIPLGGYVKFVDDENSASAPSKAALERLPADQRDGAFQTKPLSQRAAVVAAGPAFNIISAMLILSGSLWAIGNYSTKAVIDDVAADGAAARAGLKAGDRIVSIGSNTITKFSDLQRIVTENVGKPLQFAVERAGRREVFTVTPELREVTDALCNKVSTGVIGVRRDAAPRVERLSETSNAWQAGLRRGDVIVEAAGTPVRFESELRRTIMETSASPIGLKVQREGGPVTVNVTPKQRKLRDANCKEVLANYIDVEQFGSADQWVHHTYNFTQAVAEGTSETFHIARQIILSLPKLPGAILKVMTGQRQSEIGGPIAIAEMTAHASENGISSLLGWVAVFSIMLGIMNLLPIPLLDGGHLLFYAVEAVRGQPLDERKQELSFKIGMALLATMMGAAIIGDVMRKFGIG